jgi:hypothetical protein
MTADATTDETVGEIMVKVIKYGIACTDRAAGKRISIQPTQQDAEAAIRALVEERDRAQHHAEEARQDHELGMADMGRLVSELEEERDRYRTDVAILLRDRMGLSKLVVRLEADAERLVAALRVLREFDDPGTTYPTPARKAVLAIADAALARESAPCACGHSREIHGPYGCRWPIRCECDQFEAAEKGEGA